MSVYLCYFIILIKYKLQQSCENHQSKHDPSRIIFMYLRVSLFDALEKISKHNLIIQKADKDNSLVVVDMDAYVSYIKTIPKA